MPVGEQPAPDTVWADIHRHAKGAGISQMTKTIALSDFVERQRRYRRTIKVWNSGFSVVYFAVLLGNLWFTRAFNSSGWSPATEWAWLGMFFLFVLGAFVVSMLMNRILAVRYALLCPLCGAKLVGSAEKIVTETRKCPRCSRTVIHD
jgi:hypothetical protein